MRRREFLKYSGALVVGSSLSLRKAMALTALPLDTLKANLGPRDLMLLPGQPNYDRYNAAFNLRTQLNPQVRVVASSPQAVQNALVWAQKNDIAFAIRSGGHSYEGFSQSRQLVIDTRGLNGLDLSDDKKSISVGAGVALGEVYTKLAASHLAIPAGSCFPVGVSGHTLGGGFGLLSRPLGLACDNVESIEMVDAFGQIRQCNDQENQDLFWALRGGGNGNFGIVTKFKFRTTDINRVTTFSITWNEPLENAIGIIADWQDWLADLSKQITGTLHIDKAARGLFRIHFAGLSIGTQTVLLKSLGALEKISNHDATIKTSPTDFFSSAKHFNGKDSGYESVLMKAKSDYVVKPLSDKGIRALLEGLRDSPVPIAIMCDTYGGAINQIPRNATAFVHRGETKYSIQYYSEWSDEGDTNRRLSALRDLYAKMRPHVSGESYVNYCDLDLGEDFAKAYWAENLPRLKQLKALYDPHGVFKHAQSISL